MNTITRLLIPLVFLGALQTLMAQDAAFSKRMEQLKTERQQVETLEKEALKQDVLRIEARLEAGDITEDQAAELKADAARRRALNIQDRQAMLDREMALLERNGGELASQDSLPSRETDRIELSIGVGEQSWIRWENPDRPVPYDRRTYSDMVLAFGLNNAIVDGQGLEDTPYKVGGSRFFEIGWAWRTRVFKNSNFLRLHYGFSFQFNGLEPKGDQYFVSENGQTTLQEFDVPLDKNKFRMDNLVLPVHFEFGPSKFREYEDRIRYSLHNQFRFGIGGYAGVNLGARQKLKYERDGERVKDKLKRDYNTSDFVYGLSAYIGVEGVLLYAKYDLNPIFQNAAVEQRNVSLGLRFDL